VATSGEALDAAVAGKPEGAVADQIAVFRAVRWVQFLRQIQS